MGYEARVAEREPTVPAPEALRLAIDGMTCASCAARVERGLNGLDGVEATVNFATDEAAVAFDPDRVDLSELVAAVEAAGYRAHRADEEPESDGGARRLLRDLAGSVVLTIPLALIAMIPALHFSGWEWVALALATPVVLLGGARFHRAAFANLRHGAATMDTLVSIGTLAAWLWSLVVLTAFPGSDTYFEVGAVITTLILLGRFLEARARRRSGAAIRALLELGAKDARVLRDGEEVVLPADRLVPGDRFVVRPGEKIATDGVVEEGSAAVDQSMLTGEPVPVDVGPGSAVAGATINTSGRLVVRATRVGAETTLAQIARLVASAQAGKAPIQRIADRVAAVFVPIVIGVAVATLVAWLAITGDASAAFTAAVTVLIIACPCALGLATPTAIMVGTGRGAQLGILIKGPEILERTRRVSTAVLDKTGTITEGRMWLAEVVPAPGEDRAELLRLAGAAEAGSEHPIARAIADGAAREVGMLPPVEEFANRAGLGIEAVVDGHALVAGRETFLAEWGLELPPALSSTAVELEARGHTVVVAAWDGEPRGLLALADRVKPTSPDAVAALGKLGLRTLLLTGDNETTARTVAASVGIDDVRANVLPDGKAEVVRELQRRGETVAMVGDGVNDAPALARADLGIAIGTGTDVAIEAGDLTLVGGDPRAIADAIRLSRRVLTTIKGNLFWAFAYNVAAIPLAIAGVLNPMVAAAAMAASSLFVVSNSLRLRRFRTAREEPAPTAPTPELEGGPA